MVLTRKTILYLGWAYVFIGLTLFLREPSLTIFVIPIALTLLYSSLVSPIGPPKIRVRRLLNPLRSFGGESIKVTVEITNGTGDNIDDIVLDDLVPDSLRIDSGTTSFHLSLKPREQVLRFYELAAPKRGRYVLGPLRAVSYDTMRFRQYSITVPGQDVVTVFPRVEELGQVEMLSRRIGPWPGTIPSRIVGPGTEFFELRLYAPGDELRRINWKASAKQRRLVTNEFETERVTDVLVVLDGSEGVLSGLFAADVEEFQVNLAASLCSQLLFQGNRVGLLVYGAERTWLPPTFGKRQLLMILNSLAISRAGPAIVPIDFVVQTIVGAVLPAHSVIAFISPLLDEEVVEAIGNVAAAGYSLLCLTPEPAPPSIHETPSKLLARRILAASRRMNRRRVLSVSRCVEVSSKSPIQIISRRGSSRRLA